MLALRGNGVPAVLHRMRVVANRSELIRKDGDYR